MFNLHVVQARYGDSLILEYGAAQAPRYILIDGGPPGIYEDDLRPVLQGIADRGGSLDFMVLSHVDDDHVVGLLDLLAEIQQQRDSGAPETIGIGEIWHNTFSQTLGGEIEARFQAFMGAAAPVRGAMHAADRTMRDIAKGDALTHEADALDIPINEQFDPSYLVSLGLTNEPVDRENLRLWIVAPNRTNLQNLREEWLEWLEEQEDRVLVRSLEEAERAATRADTRVPNLSSIMFLALADGKSMLLTGDGRGDHLLEGLGQAGLLDASGRLHVDILKLPHHGSRHNISREVLQAITADRYIVSASGRYSHPSRQTLEWIAEVAREQGRQVEIAVTKRTKSVDQLLERYDTDEYGYCVTEMPHGAHALVLELGGA
jgi:beta-lactamase superfamily II metal-dependent hydrolase